MNNAIMQYCLHLADNALILGHRNSEWTGHGPILEQDIALSNISLDLIGQARHFYQHAANLINEGNAGSEDSENSVTEDTLAYLRDAGGFRNCLLVEQPNGHWGKTVVRQFLFSNFQHLQYLRLCKSDNSQISAIAQKSVKESAYHVRWANEWMIRLGDGTEESHTRMKDALEELWRFTPELFIPAEYEDANSSAITDPAKLDDQWKENIENVLMEATLQDFSRTAASAGSRGNGKMGFHTEHLGFLLAEMQFMQRAYPGCEW